MNFGERLRSLRKDIDYSLRRMADELGISFSALGKYERNERQPVAHYRHPLHIITILCYNLLCLNIRSGYHSIFITI